MFKKPYFILLTLVVSEILFGCYLLLTIKQSLISHLFMSGFMFGMAFVGTHNLLDKHCTKEV
jgi:hypothetical protein